MKKILSLFLVLVLITSMFAGCDRPKDPTATEAPEPEPPMVHEEPDADMLRIVGVLYRTNDNAAVLLSTEHGALLLTNPLEDFAECSDFSIVEITTKEITGSEPAQATAQNCALIARAASQEELDAVADIFSEIKLLGYTPAEEATIVGSDEVIYFMPYNTMGALVDNLADCGENTMFSPLSLNLALGMAANGADAESKAKFENYFGMTIENYNNHVVTTLQNAAPWNGNTTIDIANSIWLQDPMAINDNYKELMEHYYDATANTRVFDENFVEEVNKWSAENTHNMIPTIMTAAPESDSIFMNALYFKGQWATEYKKEQVKEIDFTLLHGETVTVDGMYVTEDTLYMENEHAVAFVKYYNDYRYAFIGVLPKEAGDFNLADLDLDSLLNSANMQVKTVSSMIPKFKYDNSWNLSRLLGEIGLPVEEIALSEVTQKELYLSNIMQYTAIEVNAKGTEAAAVTVVETEGAIASGDENLPKEVFLNRPFAFMICDMDTTSPLFIGKVLNPNA